MTDDRFERLTDRERAVLRLVLVCRNSSEIGRKTGDAPTTIDKLIKTARAKLDAPDRFGAARMLHDHETGGPALGPQTQDLQPPQGFRLPLPIPTLGRPTNDLSVRERLVSIVLVAFVIAFATIGVLAFSSAIDEILGQSAHHLNQLLH